MKDSNVLKTVVMSIIAIAMLGSVVYRSAVASFTHDESYSYLYYPRLPFQDILSHTEPFTNNHLLNSLGMKAAGEIFGSSELSMRSPNILAFIIYLVYGLLLLRPLNWVVAVPGYLILVSNSELLEMFSIARGYGISIGFMLMALFHLSRAVRTKAAVHIVLFHIAGILSVLGSFVLLGTYLAMFGTYFIVRWLEIGRHRTGHTTIWKEAVLNGSMLLAALWTLHGPIARTLDKNNLDFGGKEGFFESTVFSAIVHSIPGIHIPEYQLPWIACSITLIAFFMFVACFKSLFVAGSAFVGGHLTFIAISLVLFLTTIGIVLQHHLFHVDYPVKRFALFLIPMVLLAFIFYGTALKARFARLTHHTMLALFGALSIGWLWPQFGPDRSIEWQYDLCTKEAVRFIAKDMNPERLKGGNVKIGNTWVFEPTMNYYFDVWELTGLQRADRHGPGPNDAYRYLVKNDVVPADVEGFTLIKEFETCGTVLYRKEPGDVDVP